MNGQKYTVEFETTLRGVILQIEAYALGDGDGVYHTGISAFVGGEDITGLLSTDDITNLEMEAIAALETEWEDDQYWA